jgi:Na+-driven multidrug efflux pump
MGVTLSVSGFGTGLLFALTFATSWNSVVSFFTASPEVIVRLTGNIMLLACFFQPLNGVVFVLDGLLIGARDTRYLKWAMLAGALAVFVPISWSSLRFSWGLIGIVSGVSALMVWRCATNVLRFFSRRWAD